MSDLPDLSGLRLAQLLALQLLLRRRYLARCLALPAAERVNHG